MNFNVSESFSGTPIICIPHTYICQATIAKKIISDKVRYRINHVCKLFWDIFP